MSLSVALIKLTVHERIEKKPNVPSRNFNLTNKKFSSNSSVNKFRRFEGSHKENKYLGLNYSSEREQIFRFEL